MDYNSRFADFKPPLVTDKKSHIILAAGISAAALFLGLLVVGIMSRKGWLGGKVSTDKGMDLQTSKYQIKREANVIAYFK